MIICIVGLVLFIAICCVYSIIYKMINADVSPRVVLCRFMVDVHACSRHGGPTVTIVEVNYSRNRGPGSKGPFILWQSLQNLILTVCALSGMKMFTVRTVPFRKEETYNIHSQPRPG